MKKHIIGLAAVAACAAPASAAAQTYASVAGGQGRISVDCAGASACDTKADAYRFIAGRRFAGGVSAEVGLIDFGEAARHDGAGSVDYVVTGITAGAAVDAPLSSSFGLFTRLGIAMLRTQVRYSNGFSGASSTDNSVVPYLGLGLYVTPWQNIRLELSVDQSRAEFRGSKGDVRAVMLGARVLF